MPHFIPNGVQKNGEKEQTMSEDVMTLQTEVDLFSRSEYNNGLNISKSEKESGLKRKYATTMMNFEKWSNNGKVRGVRFVEDTTLHHICTTLTILTTVLTAERR